MKRFSTVFLVLISVIILAGCEKEEEIISIEANDLILMENLDEYMFRDDVQYVDLRNYEASFKSGFIKSFEIIPFFDYLDFRVFDRNDGYDFNPDQILDEDELFRLFDPEKAIFLYADGCIRSGYLKDMLNHLGYERVFVLGGFYEYQGEYRIDGTGKYSIGNTFYTSYTDENSNYTYLMYGNLDVANNVETIRFDILDDTGATLRGTEYDPITDYDSMLTSLENVIVGDFTNFNDLYEKLLSMSGTEYEDITGVDWTKIEPIIYLIEEEYID